MSVLQPTDVFATVITTTLRLQQKTKRLYVYSLIAFTCIISFNFQPYKPSFFKSYLEVFVLYNRWKM